MKEYIYIESPNEVEGGMLLRERELIRCKDCKHNREIPWTDCELLPQMFGKRACENYCSLAEPKEDK
jgi:hypothetical protein